MGQCWSDRLGGGDPRPLPTVHVQLWPPCLLQETRGGSATCCHGLQLDGPVDCGQPVGGCAGPPGRHDGGH